jgi:hypothetical protein
MITKIERRNLTQEFRVSQEGETPKISGYAALFDTASEPIYGMWTEEIDPHAFDSVLASNPDCRALWNHNPDMPLGRTHANTLTLTLDSRGLAYVIDPPATTYANDLMVSMRRKDVTQSSFSFVCKRDQWTDNADGTATRRILEFEELLDVSPVTYPAYSATTAGARSMPDSMPREMRSRFEQRSSDKTKRVDGEDLTADCFLIVGDPDKTDTWHLPWKFSTDEKTKSHLRDALSRFDQVEGVSDAEKDRAWEKLLSLCKDHGIDVLAESKSKRSIPDCFCLCPQCMSGACGICSADPQCVGAQRAIRARMEMKLKLLYL